MLTGKRLLLMLRAEDDLAQATVLRVLDERCGDVCATARELGVSPGSLYAIARRFPAYGERFRRACQGIEGAQRAAVRTRMLRAAERAEARAAALRAAAAQSGSQGRS